MNDLFRQLLKKQIIENAQAVGIEVFRSGVIEVVLYPDSRGYVMFRMNKVDVDHPKNPPMAIDHLTCEYISDVTSAVAMAARWIVENCGEIKHGERHLYWKFKGFDL